MDRLISEQAVFKTIDNLKANFTCYDSVTLDEVASHVKAIPSAEPKTGYWIESEFDMSVYCSRCSSEYEWEYDFCPSCGADMRGDDNEG